MKKIIEAFPELLKWACLFFILAAAAGYRNTTFPFFYELWRILESSVNWTLKDKGADWGEWEVVPDEGEPQPLTDEEVKQFVEEGLEE